MFWKLLKETIDTPTVSVSQDIINIVKSSSLSKNLLEDDIILIGSIVKDFNLTNQIKNKEILTIEEILKTVAKKTIIEYKKMLWWGYVGEEGYEIAIENNNVKIKKYYIYSEYDYTDYENEYTCNIDIFIKQLQKKHNIDKEKACLLILYFYNDCEDNTELEVCF